MKYDDLNEIQKKEKWDNLRKIRNQKLTESDWVIIKCIELDDNIPQKWLDYRKALRDLPENTTNPCLPDFPILDESFDEFYPTNN